jgi:hypothetical protein
MSEAGWCRKLLWLLVLIFSNGVAIYSTVQNVTDFAKATTVTSINSSTASLSDIYFPR